MLIFFAHRSHASVVGTLDKIDKFETLNKRRFFVLHMCVFGRYAYAMDSNKKEANSMQNGSNRCLLKIAKVRRCISGKKNHKN